MPIASSCSFTTLQWGVILIFLAWVLTGAILVVRANLYAFGQILYNRHNNISASNLFLSLLRQHTLFIIAFMFAMMFLVVHIVSATGID